MPGDDVAIHFDTDFNRILMVARAAGLLVLGLWILKAWGAKPFPILIGAGLIATAVWLTVKDYPLLESYRLEVAPDGLTLQVPPDLDRLIPWPSIEALELEGFEYARLGGGPQLTPFGARHSTALDLPDWKTMTLTLSGGETHVIQLSELSIEHRQIFAKALIKRAGLVEEK